MKLKIINREKRNGLGFDGYAEWPEKLHNINSRPFKKTFNFSEYQKLQIYWELEKYIGPAPIRSMTFFSFGAEESHNIKEISLETVTNYFDENKAIDGEYEPSIGDELSFYRQYYYKGINGVKRPKIEYDTISFIYKETGWVEDQYDFEYDETAFIMNGIVIL